jgi:hypothetical protein
VLQVVAEFGVDVSRCRCRSDGGAVAAGLTAHARKIAFFA